MIKYQSKYQSHALSYKVCSYTNEDGHRERYVFYYYRKLFFIEHSIIYSTHIYCDVELFNKFDTKRLFVLFYATTARELFDAIAFSCINSQVPDCFGQNLQNMWDFIKISPDHIDAGYTFNKIQLGFRQNLLSRVRECYYKQSRDAKPSTLISMRKRVSSNVYDVCKWIDEYGHPNKIKLIFYRGCFFFVISTYYNEDIWSDVVGLNRNNTNRFFKLLGAENALQLFACFERIFYKVGKESIIWKNFMDFCTYSQIDDYDRLNYIYRYNKSSLTFTKFLFKEFDMTHTVNLR